MLRFHFGEDRLDLRQFERDFLQVYRLLLRSPALSILLLVAFLVPLLVLDFSLWQDIRLRNVDRYVAEGGGRPVNC